MKYVQISEAKIKRTWWQERGLMYTPTGYGKKIPTEYMVKPDLSGRWHRVYCCIFSNSGTLYIVKNGEDRILSTGAEQMLADCK